MYLIETTLVNLRALQRLNLCLFKRELANQGFQQNEKVNEIIYYVETRLIIDSNVKL